MPVVIGRKVRITNVRTDLFNGRTSVNTTLESEMQVLSLRSTSMYLLCLLATLIINMFII